MTNKFDVGSRLREQREGLGITQEELAERLGKTRNTVGAWERGDQYPSGEFYSVAHAWGFDVLYIVTGQRGLGTVGTLTAEEASIVDHYRAATDGGRAAARAVLDAVEKQPARPAKRAVGE